MSVRKRPSHSPIVSCFTKTTIGEKQCCRSVWRMAKRADGQRRARAPRLGAAAGISAGHRTRRRVPRPRGRGRPYQRGFWGETASGDTIPYAQTLRSANVRKGPGASFAVSTTVPADTPLTIFGRTSTGDWLQVRAPDRKGGWMSASLVKLNVDPTAIPVPDDVPSSDQPVQAATGSLRQPSCGLLKALFATDRAHDGPIVPPRRGHRPCRTPG